jgi:hypothetical protein
VKNNHAIPQYYCILIKKNSKNAHLTGFGGYKASGMQQE